MVEQRRADTGAPSFRADEEGFQPDTAPPEERRMGRERSEEHTSELQSPCNLVCRLLLDRTPPELYTLSLHDALPILIEGDPTVRSSPAPPIRRDRRRRVRRDGGAAPCRHRRPVLPGGRRGLPARYRAARGTSNGSGTRSPARRPAPAGRSARPGRSSTPPPARTGSPRVDPRSTRSRD